jgi:hypothetical protein
MKTYALGTSSRWVVSFTPRLLYPLVPNVLEARLAPEPIWTIWRNKDSFPYRDLQIGSPSRLAHSPSPQKHMIINFVSRWYNWCQNAEPRGSNVQNNFAHRFVRVWIIYDRLCGIVVRVLGYWSGGPDSIPGTTRKKVGFTQPREYNWGATW